LATFIVWRNLRGLKGGEFHLLKRIDVPGLIGLALFLGGVEYVLEEGPTNGWFESQELAIVATVAALGAVVFFRRIFTYDNPIVDMRPFQVPTYALCASLSFMVGVALFAPVFLTPLFLTSVRGYNAFQTGQVMFVQGLTMLLVSPMMTIVTRIIPDPRIVSTTGMFITALACWLQSNLTTQAEFANFVWPQILRGIGLIFAYGSLLSPALAALPLDLAHAGASLFNTVRNVGGAFGIAFMTTLQMHALALHKQELRTALDPQNPHVQQMISGMQAYLTQTGARDPERQALMDYAGILDREALVMAFNDEFRFLTVLMIGAGCLMILINLFGKPMPRLAGFGGAEKPPASSEQMALQREAHS
jgi:DHA2 family multidrug resistance protein